jgi:heptosyltransferase-2
VSASSGGLVSDPGRILVRAPNWAGDVVMATPALRALRARFPRAHVAVQVRDAVAPLLAGAPWFDERLPVASWDRGVRATLAEGRALRGRGFELGLCLPDSGSSALLMRAAGVGRVVGYGRGLRRLLLHDSVPPPRDAEGGRLVARERHALGLVAALGGDGSDTRLELFVTEAEQAEAARALAGHGIAPGEAFALLAPGASYGPAKCWPPAHFASVADALSARGLRPVLVGAPDERPLADEVARAAAARPADLTGRISLGALKAVVRGARLLVCNDAGARHMAVAFGVSVVCLMGPTSLAKTNLNLERVAVLSAPVACRPCYHRVCPTDHRCMTRLAPSRAIAAALEAVR